MLTVPPLDASVLTGDGFFTTDDSFRVAWAFLGVSQVKNRTRSVLVAVVASKRLKLFAYASTNPVHFHGRACTLSTRPLRTSVEIKISQGCGYLWGLWCWC